jgi:hypothetical protein
MNVRTATPSALIGTVRRFGPHGVLYEIIKIVDDKHALIRVLESGEDVSYPVDKILVDPAD